VPYSPKITVSLDKELSIDWFIKFMNHPVYSGSRSNILRFYPSFKKLINENINEKLIVRKFVEGLYDKNNQAIIEIISSVREKLKNAEPAFKALSKYMDFPDLSERSYKAIPTFLPFSPFFKDTFFFSIANIKNFNPSSAVFIAVHEISHFILFEQIKNYTDNQTLKTPAFHYFKEALTTAVMDQPEFREFFDYKTLKKTKTYLGNNELHNLFIGSNTIVEFLKKNIVKNSSPYIKNILKILDIFVKNNEVFANKWKIWNQLCNDQNNEKLLSEYSKPINITLS